MFRLNDCCEPRHVNDRFNLCNVNWHNSFGDDHVDGDRRRS